MKKRVGLAVVVILAVVFLGGIGVFLRREPGPSGKRLQTVSLATSTNVWCALPLIAKDRGFFEKEGLDVKVIIQDGGRYCMDALVSNSADFGNVVEINVSYLGFTNNNDVVVVGNVVESTSMAIVAWKDRGIERASDLTGKRFGFTPGTQGDLFAFRFFDKHGVKPDSMDLRKLQPKAIPASVAAHEIDAASTWEPFVNTCLKVMGKQGVVFRDPEAHTGYMHLAVRRSWADKHPDAVSAFLRALKRAQQFAAEHPLEAQQILAREMNLDIDTVKSIWGFYRIEVTMDRQRLMSLTTAVGQWIRDNQKDYRDKPLPDYSRYYDDRFIRSLR